MSKEEKLRQLWHDADITNDFVFGNVMEMGNNCRDLLRAILPELNIQKVSYLNTQKNIRDQELNRGIRLDLYAEDDRHRIYDVEMQTYHESDLGFRSRYYQSKIDIDSVKSGQALDKIKPSYLIFLMPFDLFGRGIRKYVLEQWFDPTNHVGLNTESQLIILNSQGSVGRITKELQSFFNLMNGQHDVTTHFSKKISKDTKTVKQDPEKERDFMDMALKMYDARKQGEEKGQQKGIKQSSFAHALKYARQLHQAGKTNEEIFTSVKSLFGDDLQDSEIKNIINSL